MNGIFYGTSLFLLHTASIPKTGLISPSDLKEAKVPLSLGFDRQEVRFERTKPHKNPKGTW